jgi:hypothetical protein
MRLVLRTSLRYLDYAIGDAATLESSLPFCFEGIIAGDTKCEDWAGEFSPLAFDAPLKAPFVCPA